MSGRRIVLLCACALALFSTIYSLAAWYDWWPRLPPGALHDTDLWAGFAGGVALLLVLLLNPPLRHGKHEGRNESPISSWDRIENPAAEDGFGPCATEVSEPRQVRKEAAIRRRPRAPQANLNPSSAAGL